MKRRTTHQIPSRPSRIADLGEMEIIVATEDAEEEEELETPGDMD